MGKLNQLEFEVKEAITALLIEPMLHPDSPLEGIETLCIDLFSLNKAINPVVLRYSTKECNQEGVREVAKRVAMSYLVDQGWTNVEIWVRENEGYIHKPL